MQEMPKIGYCMFRSRHGFPCVTRLTTWFLVLSYRKRRNMAFLCCNRVTGSLLRLRFSVLRLRQSRQEVMLRQVWSRLGISGSRHDFPCRDRKSSRLKVSRS